MTTATNETNANIKDNQTTLKSPLKLRINHQTNYHYDDEAKRSVQYIRMTPMALPHQIIHEWNVMLPKVAQTQIDGFGNTWMTLSRNEAHNNLQMQASGVVEIDTTTQCLPDSLPEGLFSKPNVPYLLFTAKSPLTTCSPAMREFAKPYLQGLTEHAGLKGLDNLTVDHAKHAGYEDHEKKLSSGEDSKDTVPPALPPLAKEEIKEEVTTYAAVANQPQHQPVIDALHTFAKALKQKMPYAKGVTHVGTTASEAFEIGSGVCQDHTHVFLACLRDVGIPARYVSGYLYDTSDNHMASHAWAEAWVGGYWYTFDISNQLFTPSSHVYVAIGRDYLDAAPVRGMRMGGGYENLNSHVAVEKLD